MHAVPVKIDSHAQVQPVQVVCGLVGEVQGGVELDFQAPR